jgi:hypothetical protein
MPGQHAKKAAPEMSRRLFLRRLGAAAAGAAVLGGAGYGIDALATSGNGKKGGSNAGGSSTTRPTATSSGTRTSTSTTVPPGEIPDLPTAGWLVEENSRPGSTAWAQVGTAYQSQLEGFADHVSATPGDEVTVYVNTTEKGVHLEIYRMGWYGGAGGRLVKTTARVPGQQQPSPELAAGVNTVECHWQPTVTFNVEPAWLPGNYLLRLVGDDGVAEWVPLTIRDDTSTAAVVVMNSVTTWQAYNLWGGYSLYYGQDPGGGQSYGNRARVVSFDRPYPHNWAAGTADWLGNEFPFVMLAERHGVDLAYWTDVDLHQHPERLRSHRCLVSLGHDEYWSMSMRDGAQQALDAGVNLAFLGANACYRHIRLEASPLGADRHEVCYKDGSEDPLSSSDPQDVTWNWPSGPDPRPESELIGDMYQSYGGSGDMVVADATAWPLHGTGLGAGATIAGVIGSEFDGYVPALPGPRQVDVVCHSPTGSASGHGYSDMTWYTVPNGGGVFASGTAALVGKLWDNPGDLPTGFAADAIPAVTKPLEQVTLNVMSVLGEGPAHQSFPSRANWERFYNASWGGVASSDV